MLVIAVSHGILSDGFTKNAKTEKKLSGWSEALEFVCKTHELQEDQVDEILLVGNDLTVKKLSIEDSWKLSVDDIGEKLKLLAAADKAEAEFDETVQEDDDDDDGPLSNKTLPPDSDSYIFDSMLDEDESSHEDESADVEY